MSKTKTNRKSATFSTAAAKCHSDQRLVSGIVKQRQKMAAAERTEQQILKAAAKRVLKDCDGNTQGQLQEHIKKNHKWLKPLYAKKKYGLSTMAWDLLNAHGFNFVDKWELPLRR
jgi:hypothetical protein